VFSQKAAFFHVKTELKNQKLKNRSMHLKLHDLIYTVQHKSTKTQQLKFLVFFTKTGLL